MSKVWIIVLTIAYNAAMGLVQFGLVQDGSKAAKISALLAWLLGNLMALLGQPLLVPAAAEKPKDKAPPASGSMAASVLALLFVSLSLNGCLYDQGLKIEGIASRTLTTAATKWVEVDAAQQQAIVSAAATSQEALDHLQAYRSGVQQKVTTGLQGALLAVVGLDAALKTYKAGDRSGLASAISTAVLKLGELATLLEKLKIPLVIPKLSSLPVVEVRS